MPGSLSFCRLALQILVGLSCENWIWLPNAYIATESPVTGVFNVAYGGKITINDLATSICKLIGSSSEIRHAPERAGDVKYSMAGVDRLRATGFRPQGNLVDGLASSISFFQSKSSQTN